MPVPWSEKKKTPFNRGRVSSTTHVRGRGPRRGQAMCRVGAMEGGHAHPHAQILTGVGEESLTEESEAGHWVRHRHPAPQQVLGTGAQICPATVESRSEEHETAACSTCTGMGESR